MIVKLILTSDTNIVLTYGGKTYICYVPASLVGTVFNIASAPVVPTIETGTMFQNEVEAILDETQPYILDNSGNCYLEVASFKENIGSNIPTRL